MASSSSKVHSGTGTISSETKPSVSNKSNSQNTDVTYEPADGGWGWCVVAGACVVMINLLVACAKMVIPTALTSFGVLVPEISRRYGATMAEVSWAPAIAAATWNLTAPFAAAIVKFYSHRSIAMVGALLTFAGLILSAFAENLFVLYLTYGVLGGLGATLASGVGLFLVQEYFTTNRAKANGLTMAGGSIGQMTIPLLLQLLLDTYGYRGALVVYSGIILQACVGVAFYQPSARHRRRVVKEKVPTETDLHIAPPTYKPRIRSESWSYPKGYLTVAQSDKAGLTISHKVDSLRNQLEVVAEESEKMALSRVEKHSSTPYLNAAQTMMARTTQRSFSVCSEAPEPHPKPHQPSLSSLDFMGSLAIMGSMVSLASLPPYIHPEPAVATPSDESPINKSRWWVPQCPKFSEMLQFKLLRNPFFVLSTASTAIGRLVYQEVNVLVPSFGQSLGLSPPVAASLLTILAACDTSARLLVPILSDRLASKINRIQVFTSGYFICSIACLGLSFADSYLTLAISCGIYGFGVGCNTCLGIVILVEYLGLENLTSAFGLSVFLSCFTLLPGVPLIGYIQSVTQSFSVCFFILFGLMLTCVLQWLAMPYVIRWNERRKKLRNENE